MQRIFGNHNLPIFLTIFLASALSGSAQTLVELGDFGGHQSTATAINDAGQVTGYASTASLVQNAFLYSNGTLTDLDTYPASLGNQAKGINNSGEIIGADTENGGSTTAVRFANSTTYPLGTLGGMTSYANAVNSAGTIVGASTTYNNQNHAFSYNGSGMTDLGTLGGAGSLATAINSAGQIVGESSNSAGWNHAFLYSGGVMKDLGSFSTASGDNFSDAEGINASGVVVGESTLSTGYEHAFMYANGVMTDLTPGNSYQSSNADGINNGGAIVGTYGYTGTAFLYTPTGGFQNLNVLYASLLVTGSGSKTGFMSLEDATAINDDGQIVGTGEYYAGFGEYYTEAFLLDTPEPATWAMMLGAGAVLAFLVPRIGRRA